MNSIACHVTDLPGAEPPEKLHPNLPVFSFRQGDQHVLYTPGHSALVEAEFIKALKLHWASDGTLSSSPVAEIAARFERLATNQAQAWSRFLEAPFRPECLTIYPNACCNSRCVYCFSARREARFSFKAANEASAIQPEAVRAASRLVAQNCANKALPFTLVLHGGGEPTLHDSLVRRIVEITREAAASHGTEWQGYIATNGCLEEYQLAWVAENFNHIGLSCDGPPEIHNAQRPLLDGRQSSRLVKRTARMLRDRGAHFSVRCTIMPQVAHRQMDIVSYLCAELGAREISFEPAYRLAKDEHRAFHPSDAPTFVSYFLNARRIARSMGATLDCSVIRPAELHGPFCNVLRDVLHLTSDGSTTACFLCTNFNSGSPLFLGRWDDFSDADPCMPDRVKALRQLAGHIPKRCHACPNIYHCARECPDVCLLEDDLDGRKPGFRCRVAQLLAAPLILEATLQAAESSPQTIPASPAMTVKTSDLSGYLATADCDLEAEEILEGWNVIKHLFCGDHRSLPQPVWARRGFNHDGNRAWKELSARLSSSVNQQSMAVYLHIPFCDRRCAFCDCYSFALRQHKNPTQERFVEALDTEMEAWSHLDGVRGRPVTTVHFGGGTPSTLRIDMLARIVRRIQTSLALHSQTEWALEATSSSLTQNHLLELRDIGFTRLHVGVQTLDDDIRRVIGRLEPGQAVLLKVASALQTGFILSVDVIYGLPGQMVGGLLNTLSKLIEIGVHGFSLYQLQEGPLNRRFMKESGALHRDPLLDYAMFAAAEKYLLKRGFEKNHFAHFARKEDGNLYYRHAVRGEDLLAFGPVSDGVFGDYRYRHVGFRDYMNSRTRNHPRLEGGVCETSEELHLRRVISHLMAGSISFELLQHAGAENMLPVWLGQRMLEPAELLGWYSLTANGSWFLTRMIGELEAAQRSLS